MNEKLKAHMTTIAESMRSLFSKSASLAGHQGAAAFGAARTLKISRRFIVLASAAVILGGAGYMLVKYPPIKTIGRGEVGVRVNQLTGDVSEWKDSNVFVLPGLHQMQIYSLRDQVYHPQEMIQATGTAPLQSLEGLSLGVDLTVRYALDPARVSTIYKSLPDDIGAEVVAPAVQGVIYKIFARYTVREIFSTKRGDIQKMLEAELLAKFAADGILLRSVQMGKVDLPADYRRGMDTLLAEELASEKMRYTLELKDKRVKETALDGEAEKVKREMAAEAAAREQIIAAKGQEEAMKHVLPFKQRQIEQRVLEAEAEKGARIKAAEGSAQARRIEAGGEAEARQKLADAEVYRLDKVGRTNSEQMEREGALVTKHPLLIQKTLADKLSDKIQVILAPPNTDGGFLGDALLGGKKQRRTSSAQPAEEQE